VKGFFVLLNKEADRCTSYTDHLWKGDFCDQELRMTFSWFLYNSVFWFLASANIYDYT